MSKIQDIFCELSSDIWGEAMDFEYSGRVPTWKYRGIYL